MKKNICILILSISLAGCSFFQKDNHEGVVVELNDHTLSYTELDAVTATAHSPEDSARMAEAYIQQWATQILEYSRANDVTSDELEQLVEDYRRSLYIHEYEKRLIARNCPQTWSDSLIVDFYANHKERLVLNEGIVKGVFMIVPKATPHMAELQKKMSNLSDNAIEYIEKYAYQYATSYEYFLDKWCPISQILVHLPVETDIVSVHKKPYKPIVVEDSVSIYMLQITDKCLPGEIPPFDYARQDIEQILLNQWKVSFLENERQNLYNNAVKANEIKRYEKE